MVGQQHAHPRGLHRIEVSIVFGHLGIDQTKSRILGRLPPPPIDGRLIQFSLFQPLRSSGIFLGQAREDVFVSAVSAPSGGSSEAYSAVPRALEDLCGSECALYLRVLWANDVGSFLDRLSRGMRWHEDVWVASG